VFGRIDSRIALGYVALLSLAMLLLGVFLVQMLRAQQYEALEAQLERQARLVAEDARSRLLTQGPAALDPLAKQLGGEAGARVTLIAADGTVLGDSDFDPARMENHAGRAEVAQALADGLGEARRRSATLDRDLLYLAVPIRHEGRTLGVARVALPVHEIQAALNRVAAAVATAFFVTSALAIGLAVLIARAIARPIQELTESARRLAEGDLRQPLAVRAGGEVGELADTFNTMAARLRGYIEAVEAERTRLAAVLAHIPDGVIIADAAGRVSLSNPAAARLLRFSPEAAGGHPLIEVARDHELAELVDRALRGAALATTSRLVEVGPPGVRGWIQAIASRLPDHTGAGSRVLLVLQDVTELRRTEAIRRDFVANVSHELRTPVASLKAMVETLEEGALEDPPAARDFLARMHVEVDGLIQLIEELLALSRIESGRLAAPMQPTDLGPVVTAAAERLRTQADRQGVAFEVVVAGPLPPVLADPEGLRQVVINLVHNAIKFTPPGGRITVQVEPEARGRDVLVRVRDTGEGIPAGDLERLFERFYKADKSRATGGTGLGLAIAKHLVQAHGGRIWAESAGPGRGATFTVALPALAAAAVPAD
jgi:two-component system, OmpR family, phosphate regulon sensor histidine kinase PhoR